MDKYTALIEKYRRIIDDLSEQYNKQILHEKAIEYFNENELLKSKTKEKETLENDICMHINKLSDLKKYKKAHKEEYDEFCMQATMPFVGIFLIAWFLYIILNFVTSFGWAIIMFAPTIYVFIKVLNKVTIPYFNFKERRKINKIKIETLNEEINKLTKAVNDRTNEYQLYETEMNKINDELNKYKQLISEIEEKRKTVINEILQTEIMDNEINKHFDNDETLNETKGHQYTNKITTCKRK